MSVLLRTKLYRPTVRPDLVSRQRLMDRLNARLWSGANFTRKLTLISAPAGYGKTTLTAEWLAALALADGKIASSPIPQSSICWLALDENDNDLPRFWTYVIAALQTAQPAVGETALAMLHAPAPPPIETMLTALINDLAAAPAPLILALDDYHLIHTQGIHDALAFFLDYLPPHLHLVLTTRVDPPLNLSRLRIRQQMVEVRADDLRFTSNETTLFLNSVMQLALAPPAVAALETRTEGWIAGLQVAAMALQGHGDVGRFIAAFTGSHRHILSYLIEEVFQKQPAAIQTFLLHTSILDRLSGPLCDVVAGTTDGQETLEYLEAANLFVTPLDEARQWYRYHHLFSDVLRVKLRRDCAAAEIQALHRAASQWYVRQGQRSEAVQHALLTGDFEYAAALIVQFADAMLMHSELTTLQRWLDALPAAQVHASAHLSIIAAWVLLAGNQIEAVEPHLQNVERALGLTKISVETLSAELRGARCEVLCIRANLAFHHTDLARVLVLSEQARACLTADVQHGLFHPLEGLQAVIAFNTALAHEFSGAADLATPQFEDSISFSRLSSNTHLIMIAFSHLAQMQRIRGQLRQAEATCAQALQFVAEGALPPSPFLGMVHVGLGDVWYEWNDLRRAAEHLQQGIAMARSWHNWETLSAGYLSLARVAAAQGRWDVAERTLTELLDSLSPLQAPWNLPLIQAQRAQFAVQRGDLDAAATWAQRTDLAVDGALLYLREPETLILARVLAALGRLDEAATLFARLLTATEAGGRYGRLIEVLIGQALVSQAQGQPAALTALRRALTLAEPQGYVRVFADAGEALAPLLAVVDILPAYVGRLRAILSGVANQAASPSAPPPSASAGLLEPLSERELELLRLLAAGQTNQEIAAALVVSLNTVKTHVHSIFGKLTARNRTEATLRARELGLL